MLTIPLRPPRMRACQERHDSALAQLVEQMTVNHWVAGSSPAGGATFIAYLLVLFQIALIDTVKGV